MTVVWPSSENSRWKARTLVILVVDSMTKHALSRANPASSEKTFATGNSAVSKFSATSLPKDARKLIEIPSTGTVIGIITRKCGTVTYDLSNDDWSSAFSPIGTREVKNAILTKLSHSSMSRSFSCSSENRRSNRADRAVAE